MKDVIYEPKQADIDDQLMLVVNNNEEYKEVYSERRKHTYEESKEVDQATTETNEEGKKKFTYKNQAESRVKEQNRDRSDRIEELDVQKKLLDRDYEVLKMVYYHARDKITTNSELDKSISRQAAEELLDMPT